METVLKCTGATRLKIMNEPFAATVLWTAASDVRGRWPGPPSPGWPQCSGSSGRRFWSRPPPSLTSHTARCWSSSPCWPRRGPRPVWTACPRWRPACGRWGWRTCCAPRRCGGAARCWRSRRRRRRRWAAWRSAARTDPSRSRAAGRRERTRGWRGTGRRRKCLGRGLPGRGLQAGSVGAPTAWCRSPRVWSPPAPASWTDWSVKGDRIQISCLLARITSRVYHRNSQMRTSSWRRSCVRD